MAEPITENKPRPIFSEWENSPFMRVINQNLKGDTYIWLVIISLALLSMLVVYSATGTLAYRRMEGNTEHYLFKHTSLIVLSLLAMWIAHHIDYRYYSKLSRLALFSSVPLLLLSWRFGVNINEASRWITIPLINQSFQPSDLAKLALLSHLASMLAKSQKNIEDFQESIQPALVWIGLICALIGLTNISNALLLFATCLLLLFLGRVPVKYLILVVLVGILSVMLALYVGQRFETAKSRIEKFANSEEVHFQAEQSFIAIATGGFLGKGPGNSDQRNFIPHPYSDFVFAIIVEEYGMFGAMIVLAMYLVFLYRGLLITARTEHPFGGLLAAGLTFSLVLQALVNMAVSVGLVPITGIPLPFLSMGGTSLLFSGVAVGIVLSISRGEIDEDFEKNTLENKLA